MSTWEADPVVKVAPLWSKDPPVPKWASDPLDIPPQRLAEPNLPSPEDQFVAASRAKVRQRELQRSAFEQQYKQQALATGRQTGDLEMRAATDRALDMIFPLTPEERAAGVILPDQTPQEIGAQNAAGMNPLENAAMHATQTLAKTGTGLIRASADAIAIPGVRQAVQPAVKEFAAQIDRNADVQLQGQGGVSGIVGQAGGSVISSLPALMNPAAAGPVLGTLGASAFGQSKLETDDRVAAGEVSPIAAEATAAGNAAVEVITEKLGLDFARRFGGEIVENIVRRAVGKAITAGGKAAVAGAGEEGIAQIGGNVADMISMPEKRSAAGAVQGVPEAAAVGGFAGAMGAGVAAGTQSPSVAQPQPATAGEKWRSDPLAKDAPGAPVQPEQRHVDPRDPPQERPVARRPDDVDPRGPVEQSVPPVVEPQGPPPVDQPGDVGPVAQPPPAREESSSPPPVAPESPSTPISDAPEPRGSSTPSPAQVSSDDTGVSPVQQQPAVQQPPQAEAVTQPEGGSNEGQTAPPETATKGVLNEPTPAAIDPTPSAAPAAQSSDAPRTLPQLEPGKEGSRRPLKELSDTLHMEAGPRRAIALLDELTSDPITSSMFAANTPDLALGQGDNRGFYFEIDPTNLEGVIDTSKPMWRAAYDQGHVEVKWGGRAEQVRPAVRAVTYDPKKIAGLPWERRRLASVVFPQLERRGWTRTNNPDGTVTYARPGSRSAPPPTVSARAEGPVAPVSVNAPNAALPDPLTVTQGQTSASDATPTTETQETVTQKRRPVKKVPGKFSRAGLEHWIVQHFDETEGAIESEMAIQSDAAVSGITGSTRTFLRDPKTKTGYPGEVEHFFESPEGKKARQQGMFKLTDNPASAGGSDALAQLGVDEYFADVVRRSEDSGAGKRARAIAFAKRSPEPKAQLYAAMYENMPPMRERTKKEVAPVEQLPTGTKFTHEGHEFEIIDEGDGYRVLRDGEAFPDVPADAIDEMPVDKGSVRKPAPEKFYEAQSPQQTGIFGQPEVLKDTGSQQPLTFEVERKPVVGRGLPGGTAADAKIAAQYDPAETNEMFAEEEDPEVGPSGSGGAALHAAAASGTPFLQTSAPQAATVPTTILRPVPLVEMTRFVRTILGDKVPQVRARMKALGYFKADGPTGSIRIRADQAEDARQLAGVLAHEVGHAVDYVPDSTLKRGNALGRIASLRNYLRHSIEASPGGATKINVREIRQELLDVSQWWRGPIVGTDSHTKYRRSSKELYADALSVLLNSPGELQQRAPKFFNAFLAHMKAKPEVQQAYLDVQDILAGTPEEIAAYRRQDVREMFAEGEEIWKVRRAEIENGKQSWPNYLRQLLFDKSIPVLSKQAQAVKGAVPWDEALAAKHALEELNMSGNALHLWAKDVHEQVTKPLTDAGLDRDLAGEYLFMTRIAFGDRGGAADAAQQTIMQMTGKPTWAEAKAEFAPMAAAAATATPPDPSMAELLELAQSGKINPKGYTPESAKEYLGDMQKNLGPQKYQRLEELMQRFRDMQWAQVQEGVKAGTYNQKMVDDVLSKNKDSYAPFAVLKYLDTKVKAGIFKQIGTFEDVANPLDAALLKTMSLIRLNELQKAKREVVGLMQMSFAGEIGQPQPIDQYHRAKPPGQGRENLILLEDGKPVAYEVDDYIAKVFNHHDVGSLARVGRWISSKTYGVFHPLWVGWNIGWQFMNVPRDFERTYTNAAILRHRNGTIRQAVDALFDFARIPAAYAKALPTSIRRARGIEDPKIRKMLEDRALDTPFIRQRPGDDTEQYDRFLMETGVWEKPNRGKILGMLQKLLDGVETIGTITETVPKVAMFDMATRAGLSGRERAYVVRNYAGTPNTKRKGLTVDVHNALWTYSNVILQGYRADAEIGVNPKTAGGRWLRAALINYLPKTVMIGAAAGLMGDWLEEWFKEVPEYDKTKYIIIPLGRESESGKPVYLRLPHNDTDRVFGAVYWKLFSKKGVDGASEAIGIASGEFPGINPYVQMIHKWGQYAAGENPRDDFRGRDIIGRDEQLVGGWERLKPMLLWTTDQFGAPGQYVRAAVEWKKRETGGSTTTTEKVLSATPGFSRLVKVSDRGAKEADWQSVQDEDRERAAQRLSQPQEVRALSEERSRLNRLGDERLDAEERARRVALNSWFSTYQNLRKALEAQEQAGFTVDAARTREQMKKITDRLSASPAVAQ